jgi:Protein of unknown function (DUF2442)
VPPGSIQAIAWAINPGGEVAGAYMDSANRTHGWVLDRHGTSVLHGELFGPLGDVAVFNAAKLDTEAGTLVWPNGADFDPATLHDWPQVCDELARRAQAWRASPSERRVG